MGVLEVGAGGDHFADVGKMVTVGSGAGREIADIRLDRYACYLVAQNGDGRKRPVAFAQTYFAIQTRRQELTDRDGIDFGKLSENHQRLYLREQVVSEIKKLNGAAKAAGVETGKDFAKFHNKGYQGLYGGRGANFAHGVCSFRMARTCWPRGDEAVSPIIGQTISVRLVPFRLWIGHNRVGVKPIIVKDPRSYLLA
jgi:hypothetical protein